MTQFRTPLTHAPLTQGVERRSDDQTSAQTQAESHLEPKFQQAWERVTAKLRFFYGEATYNSWFKSLSVKEASNHEITLTAPSRFIRDWVQGHYSTELESLWRKEIPTLLSLEIRLDAQAAASQTSSAASAPQPQSMEQNDTTLQQAQPAGWNNTGEIISTELDPRFTFTNFVVGSSNALAHAAAKSVSESSGVVAGSNPLFIYGGVGLGKTHLMHAIGWHIRANNPKRKVIYLSAEKFMYLFIQALKNKDIVRFKQQLRSVDVLMIDDVQFICGKDSTQEEFFHTFNALIESNSQLVITADRSPSDLDGMEERIRSRLGWGLVADVNPTTYELRLGILQSKVEQLRTDIPQDVLEFLARRITTNTRELEGALNKVVAHARLMQKPITLDNTAIILQDLLRASTKMVTIDDIKKIVAEHCNVRVSDMHSARRSRNIARPRQMAMYLSKKLTTHSLPEIGRQFGGKDHTTVMHAVKKIEELKTLDKHMHEDLSRLMRLLQG